MEPARAAPAPRRRLETDARRSEILQAALEAYAIQSPDSVPMAELARRAGSSPALIYHYFGDRDGLATAALSLAADELIAAMQVDPTATVAEQLDTGLGIYLDYLAAHPASWTALLRAGSGSDEGIAAIARRVDDHATALSVRAVTGSIDGPPLLELAIRGWLEMVKSSCLHWLATGTPARPVLHALLSGTFAGCVEAARSADPGAPYDRMSP